jgi:hypothetical protein
MALILATFDSRLVTDDGAVYRARACGRERPDRLWEGWLEFVPGNGRRVIRSGRETTQPNLRDLEYWATGLTAVYLEGALARALTGPPRRRGGAPVETPAYDEPAPARSAPEVEGASSAAVLDPFSVYANGEDLLRQHLHALSPRHLQQIVRAYDLVHGLDMDLEALTEPELIAVIVSAVRARS